MTASVIMKALDPGERVYRHHSRFTLNLSASAPEKDTIQSCKRCADTFRRDVSDGFFERTREGWNLFVDQSYHRQEAGAL